MTARYPDLNHENVLVTGGANGIGKAIVQAFAAQGAHLWFCDVDTKAGRALERELGSSAQFTAVDLTREAAIQRWVRAVGKQASTLRAVINNAARDPRIELEKTSSKDWDDLFALNLRAYFLVAREAAPLLSIGASVVNIASITFNLGPANMAAYVSTKGGVVGLTRALARALGPRRIRVNALSPGWVMTERQLRMYVDQKTKAMIRKSQCIPELLEAADIANVVLFLASSASAAVTGQHIMADRGWTYL